MDKDIIPEDIILEIKKIIKSHFNIKDCKNLNTYNSFLTDERLKEIYLYKGYQLNSRHIYNLVYKYLVEQHNLEKSYVVKKLRKSVEADKAAFENIKQNNWMLEKHQNYDKIKAPKNINRNLTEIYNEKYNKLPLNDEMTIKYAEYVFCTNCGMNLCGFVSELGYTNCMCNEKKLPIDCRTKHYCGKCGKHLNSEYCGYCGAKNY